STPQPTHANLIEWIRKYPQFEKELTEFTVSWSVMETLPEPEEPDKNLEDSLMLKGVSLIQNLLYEMEQEQKASKGEVRRFRGISNERQKANLSLKKTAEDLRLSPGLTTKLDQGYIQPASI